MPSLILIVPLKREKGKNPMILLTCEFISEIESACNAGEPGLIPGSGRSPAEGIGYPFQYTWASLVAQLGKNLPAMRDTWV